MHFADSIPKKSYLNRFCSFMVYGAVSLGDTDTSSVTRSPLDQIRLDHSAVYTLGGSAAR